MKSFNYLSILALLFVGACSQDKLSPVSPVANGAARESAATTTFNNEPFRDFDGLRNPQLFGSVPGSLNRTLWGQYDSDYNAFDAIAGVTYTVSLSNFDVNNSQITTNRVRLELYLPNVVFVSRTPDGTTSFTFTATQSVRHTVVVGDQNSDLNTGASLGDYTITVTRSGTPQQVTQLSAISLNPSSVTGGRTSTGTVTLSAAAPVGGASVLLGSNTSGVSVAASVVVPAGAFSSQFTISTQAVKKTTSASITASFGGSSKSAVLSVTR